MLLNFTEGDKSIHASVQSLRMKICRLYIIIVNSEIMQKLRGVPGGPGGSRGRGVGSDSCLLCRYVLGLAKTYTHDKQIELQRPCSPEAGFSRYYIRAVNVTLIFCRFYRNYEPTSEYRSDEERFLRHIQTSTYTGLILKAKLTACSGDISDHQHQRS